MSILDSGPICVISNMINLCGIRFLRTVLMGFCVTLQSRFWFLTFILSCPYIHNITYVGSLERKLCDYYGISIITILSQKQTTVNSRQYR